MDVSALGSVLVTGLATGAIYALLAMSYNVIFATTGVLNFAQGELFMVGAMIGVFLFVTMSWPVGLALLGAIVVAALVAGGEERFAIRPALRSGRGALGWVLSTLGVAIVLRSGFSLIFGPEIRSFPDIVPTDSQSVLGVRVSWQQGLLVAVAVVVAVVLSTVYRRTLTGRALSAIAQDREAAALRGLPVARLTTLAFVLGGLIAGLVGFVAAPSTSVYPAIGLVFALKGFIAAAVGGIPRIGGALAGGLLLGVVEALGVFFIGPGYRNLMVFAMLLLILTLKPAGLFGRSSVRAV